MGLWGRCDAVERTRSRPPKPRLGVRKTLTDTRPGAIPAAAGAHPRHHVICTPFPPVPGCEWAYLLARSRVGRKEVVSIKREGAGGGTNVRTAEAGRQVGRNARARPRPEVTAGRLGRVRARRPSNRMCARRAGEGRACPSPEAALAAAVPLAERLYGPGLASPVARRPPGPPPPVRARSGAPPLGPTAYTQRSREGGYGLARRGAARASQVVSPSLRPGGAGGWRGRRTAADRSAPRAEPPAGLPTSSGEGSLGPPSRLAGPIWLAC